MTTDRFSCQNIKADTFDSAGSTGERFADDIAIDADGLKDTSTFVTGQRGDPHFGQDLQHAFFDTRLISFQTIFGRHVRIWILTVMLNQSL